MPEKSAKKFNADDMIIRCAVDEDIAVLRELFERSRVEGQTRDAKKTIKYLLTTLLNVEEPNRDRVSSLQNYMKTQHNEINNETVTGLLTLITAMPEYQLC